MQAIKLLIASMAPAAHAQLSEIANTVSNGLVPFFFGDGEGGTGAYAYAGITGFILERAWLLVGISTLLLLVRAGIKLIYGQSDDKIEESKRAIANGLMAVVLVFLTSRLVDAFYRVGGTMSPADVAAGTSIFSIEILGIVRWVQVLVAVLAIGMIVASVFAAMFSMGAEDGITRMRRAVFGAAGGIIILGMDVAYRAAFGLEYFTVPQGPSPFPIISRALVIISYLLGFLALAAVCIVIYAGIVMILSLGNEDRYKAMKSLILRSLLGLFVIFVSIIIVRFVMVAIS